jgi:pimeloyl-ACP methyl ester carboxylesterase
MEQTFLTGRHIPQADILSLIPPRPCLLVVGRDSGEEAGHRSKMNGMLPFYEGLGVDTDRCRLVLVDGVHNMEQPKREPCYAWLNKWFARENEGAKEPPLAPETPEALGCTETGLALRDLGGESGRTLNAQAAERLRPRRRIPGDLTSLEAQRARVRSAVARRIGLQLPEDRQPPRATACGSVEGDVFRGVKLLLDSEDGIFMPSLLLRPKTGERNLPVILFVSELGKPFSVKQPSPVVELVRQGFPVLAVDVRGSGETDPRVREFLSPVTEYDRLQFRFDTWAVEAASLGTTMLAMRTYDVVRGIDYLESCQDLSRRRVLLIGEGLGGVWALAAAAFDGRPAGAICVAATPSYKLIVESQYYALRDYYWVSGALRDFDLPDLIGLAAPKSVTLIDPVDAMLRPIEPKRREQLLQWSRGVYGALGVPEKLQCVGTADGSPEQVARQLVAAARRIGS